MDLGIGDIRGSLKSGPTIRNRIVSKDEKEVYHIGIIDYLQTYDIVKKAENAFKSSIKPKKRSLITAVPALLY